MFCIKIFFWSWSRLEQSWYFFYLEPEPRKNGSAPQHWFSLLCRRTNLDQLQFMRPALDKKLFLYKFQYKDSFERRKLIKSVPTYVFF